jgi:hypothetical protein
MIPGRITGATHDLGKPADWDDSKGRCASLPVRQVLCAGELVMISAWQPTPEELRKLNLGESVHLMIWGNTHPVVALGVGEID